MEKGFSLSELNQHLKKVVEYNMRQAIWVRAEIAELKTSKGFTYLQLIERSESQTIAKMNSVILPSDYAAMHGKWPNEMNRILQVGQEILLFVKVVFHEVFGLSLQIKDIDIEFILGKLEIEKKETLLRLHKEGYVDMNKSLFLQRIHFKIAVISSKEAAGYIDFKKHLHENGYGYTFETTLFQSSVQGIQATSELCKAFQQINTSEKTFDCVVVIRGGGAKLDLIAFDDYEVCRSIAQCKIPVLTGIGHDVDETLSDKVAHRFFKTPTAVADFFIHQRVQMESYLHKSGSDINRFLQNKVHQAESFLALTMNRINHSYSLRIQNERNKIELLSLQLQQVNPESVLNKGYAMIFNERGVRVLQTMDLKENEVYFLQMKDGTSRINISNE
jgi:exodeoxyribonuclease VII large subunit